MWTIKLSEVQVGDKVAGLGDKTFDEPYEVLRVQRYKGSPVVIFLEGGRFWPMQPGRSEVTSAHVVA